MENDKIISLDRFRKDRGLPARTPAAQKEEPAYLIMHDVMRALPLDGPQRSIYLRSLLNSLNGHLALERQKDAAQDYTGIRGATLPLFAYGLAPEAFEEFTNSYRDMLRRDKPRRHYRIAQRAKDGKPESLQEAFGRAVIADSPAYRHSAGLLRRDFPAAALRPVAFDDPRKGIIPCIEVTLPFEDDDLRAAIRTKLEPSSGRVLQLVPNQ